MGKRKSIAAVLCGMFLCTVLLGFLCGCGETVGETIKDLPMRQVGQADPEKISQLSFHNAGSKDLTADITDQNKIQEILAPMLELLVEKPSVQPDVGSVNPRTMTMDIKHTDGALTIWRFWEEPENGQFSIFVIYYGAREGGFKELEDVTCYKLPASFDCGTYIENLIEQYLLKSESL